VTHGVHCRLENLSDEGRWLEDESFYHLGQLVVRKAGELAPPSTMAGWRKLRKHDPGLFSTIRVWQQPCAVADSIIWRWQLNLEASEYRQAVRVTDCLGAVWTPDSKEAAFLLQQINCPVAPGCTPLQQPTDTHLAKPAKDGGRRCKENLRELFRLAALKLGKPVEYKSTPREVLLVAEAMHSAMTDLNQKTEVVLQAARACGWLAYRPGATGKLTPAGQESWAAVHLQAAGRVSADQLADRYSWLDATGKPLLPEEGKPWQQEAEEDLRTAVDPQAPPEADCLCLDFEVAHLDSADDYQAALAALQHPKKRLDEDLEKQLAELGWYKKELAARVSKEGLTASPGKHCSPGKHKLARERTRELRSALAEKFRATLSAKGGVAARLADLLPATKKKPPKSAAYRKRKNNKRDKRNKKLSWLRKEKKRLAAKTKAEEAAPALLGKAGGSWEGCQVRLVDHNLTDLLRNSSAVVKAHYSTGLVTVTCASGSVRTFPQDRLWLLTGKEKLPLPEVTPDLRQLTKAEKARALLAAGNQLTEEKVTASTLLESPELSAAWEELGYRARLAGDTWPNPNAVLLNIQELDFWTTAWQKSPGSPESQEGLAAFRQAVTGVCKDLREAAFVLMTVYAAGHSTLLTLTREAAPAGQAVPNKFDLVYKDSLPVPSAACRKKAALALSLAVEALGPDKLAQQTLPEVALSAKQPDSTSCGFHVLAAMEEQYRLYRGEGAYRLPVKWPLKALDLTKFFKSVLAAKPKAKAKAEPDPGLPPLPPPSDPPPEAPLAAAAAAQPLPLPGAPVSQESCWGCARCRHAKSGCLSCNPAKMQRAADGWAGFELPASKRSRQG